MLHGGSRRSLVGCLAAGLVACGATDHGASGVDVGGPDSAAGDPSTMTGVFQVRLVAAASGRSGYTSVVGRIYDGPVPSLFGWLPGAKEGDCQLFTPKVPFCAPSCSGSAACVGDGVCQAYPTSRSVGIVRVKGIATATGASEFSMEPEANSYQPAESLPLQSFQEGDLIRFEAQGDYFPGFAVEARGIGALHVTNESLSLAEDQELILTWDKPRLPENAKIRVKLDLSHHGGTKGKIDCETNDTGSLRVAASLLTQLLRLGVAGFPSMTITRSSSGTAASADNVVLEVSSEVERQVQVAGVVSCNDDADCPDGGICQKDRTCK